MGVAVVYDSVGKDTFSQSLDVLRPLGLMVSYGNSSGPVPPVAPLELSRRGSLYLTRPTLDHYVPTRAALEGAVRELFARREVGQGEDPRRADLCTQECGRGASRSRSAPHDGLDRPHSLRAGVGAPEHH